MDNTKNRLRLEVPILKVHQDGVITGLFGNINKIGKFRQS